MKRHQSVLILTVILIATMIPVTSVPAMAAGPSSKAEITTRINELCNSLDGQYFNVGHSKEDCGYKASKHGCDNCLIGNIMQAQWFKEKFGTVKAAQLPISTVGQKSCMGFVNFAMWYIFRANDNDSVGRVSSDTMNFNYENVSKYARVGDYLRLGGQHSVIFIDYNADGITVLDCNYGGEYNCIVQKHTIPYKNYSKFFAVRAYSKLDEMPVNPFSKPSSGTNAAGRTSKPVVSVSDGNATVSWNYSGKASSYDVYLVQSPWRWEDIKYHMSAASTSCVFKNVAPGDYQVFVIARPNKDTKQSEWTAFTVQSTSSKNVKITFNANGGSVSQNSKTVISGSTYGSLPTPTRDGYTFDGWYTSASGGSQVTSGTTCSSNITLYAHWTAVPPVNPSDQQCEVILDDGSACRRMTVTKGNTYGTLPMPTQDGYTFDCWYTSASGGSQVTSSSTCSSNVTLYAHWTPIPTQETVKITFDPNGGNTTLRSKDITAGSLLTGLPTATRSGYTFLGWTTDRIDPDASSTYTAVVVGEGAFSFDQDTTLYAFWKKNRANYTAFFDANGGSVPQSSKTVTEGYYYGDLPTPSKNGYTFKGWYTSAAGGSEITSRTTFSDSSDITLYAHWEKQNTGYWGSWSGWSTTPAYESSTRQVETRSIQTSSGETEYRYGRYIDSTGGHICWCSTYLGSKGYSGITVQYSSWSTTRYGASGKVWTCGNCNGSHTGIDHYDSQGRPAWTEYSLSSGSYYWEESRQTSDTYETQYRYRDLFSE